MTREDFYNNLQSGNLFHSDTFFSFRYTTIEDEFYIKINFLWNNSAFEY